MRGSFIRNSYLFQWWNCNRNESLIIIFGGIQSIYTRSAIFANEYRVIVEEEREESIFLESSEASNFTPN